jgi:hypothetical protein
MGTNGETWGEESTTLFVVVVGRVDFGYMPAYMQACMK